MASGPKSRIDSCCVRENEIVNQVAVSGRAQKKNKIRRESPSNSIAIHFPVASVALGYSDVDNKLASIDLSQLLLSSNKKRDFPDISSPMFF